MHNQNRDRMAVVIHQGYVAGALSARMDLESVDELRGEPKLFKIGDRQAPETQAARVASAEPTSKCVKPEAHLSARAHIPIRRRSRFETPPSDASEVDRHAVSSSFQVKSNTLLWRFA